MAIVEKILDFDIRYSDIISFLKDELQNKESLFTSHSEFGSNSIYTFRYKDKIKDQIHDINLEVVIAVSKDKQTLHKIVVSSLDNTLNSYDLEFYYYSQIYEKVTKQDYNKSKKKYTIRVYKCIQHDTGFNGEYIINWKSKVRFKPLLNEPQKNYIADRIITFDIEIEAVTFSQARSKALNLIKDFTAFLSVLIDTGFSEFESVFSHFVTRVDAQLIHNFQRKSFIDPELSLIILDNMNGIHHYEDYQEIQPLTYYSLSSLDLDTLQTETTVMQNNEKLTSIKLERTFKNFKIEKSKHLQNDYAEEIDMLGLYTTELKIPRHIRKYFKAILEIEQIEPSKYNYFRNCCRLYNISQTSGANEPTLMLSYMVSAVDTLAKASNNKLSFSGFMKTYLGEDYDKEFCDFLFGHIRSGHFHSGEFYFGEYNTNLDITFDSTFKRMQELYLKAKHILRKVIVMWIKKELLKEI